MFALQENTLVKDNISELFKLLNHIGILAGFIFCSGFSMSLSDDFPNTGGERSPLSSHLPFWSCIWLLSGFVK